MAAYKYKTIKMSLEDAVATGKGDCEEIKQELDDWKCGMEDTNLENSDKYSTLEEAVSGLEDVDSLDEPHQDIIDLLDSKSILVEVSIQVPTRKKYNTSRAVRLSNAQAHLSGAYATLEGVLNDLEEDKENTPKEEWTEEMEEKYQTMHDAISSYMEELDSAQSSMDVEVPGMY